MQFYAQNCSQLALQNILARMQGTFVYLITNKIGSRTARFELDRISEFHDEPSIWKLVLPLITEPTGQIDIVVGDRLAGPIVTILLSVCTENPIATGAMAALAREIVRSLKQNAKQHGTQPFSSRRSRKWLTCGQHAILVCMDVCCRQYR
jgi:hypothetical protein